MPPFSTVREVAAIRAIERSLSRSIPERQIRKAQLAAAAAFSLEHRGAWVLPDVGAQSAPLLPATSTVTHYGDWGKELAESPACPRAF